MINPLRVASDGYLRTSTISVASRGYIFLGGSPFVPDGGGGYDGEKNKKNRLEIDNNEMLLLFDIFTKIV